MFTGMRWTVRISSRRWPRRASRQAETCMPECDTRKIRNKERPETVESECANLWPAPAFDFLVEQRE